MASLMNFDALYAGIITLTLGEDASFCDLLKVATCQKLYCVLIFLSESHNYVNRIFRQQVILHS